MYMFIYICTNNFLIIIIIIHSFIHYCLHHHSFIHLFPLVGPTTFTQVQGDGSDLYVPENISELGALSGMYVLQVMVMLMIMMMMMITIVMKMIMILDDR